MNENHDEQGRFAGGDGASSAKAGPGTKVAFAKIKEAGDKNSRFRIVEDRGSRVLVQATGGNRLSGRIQSQHVFNKADLRVVSPLGSGGANPRGRK